MSKVLRASAVLVAAGLTVPLWAVPSAFAESATEAASIGAYFYRQGVTTQNQGLPAEPPAAPPNVTGDNADGVAKGNLAVSAQGGQEDKVSFLSFSLASAPLEGTIDSALLSVPLVPSAPPANIAFNEAPELVRVCKAGDPASSARTARASCSPPSACATSSPASPASCPPTASRTSSTSPGWQRPGWRATTASR